MKRLLLVTAITLLPFSLSGMEKEKPGTKKEKIHIPKTVSSEDSIEGKEDKNAFKIIQNLRHNSASSDIMDWLNTYPININFHARGPLGEILTITRCALERCNPNNPEDIALIKLILEKGAMLEQKNKDGWEPYLNYAVRQAGKNNDNLNIIKLLIKHGTDVNFRILNEDGFGDSALATAINYDTDTKNTIINYLLENGADTNEYNRAGHTPLAQLALCACSDTISLERLELLVEKLLEHKADISIKQKIYDLKTKSLIEKSNYDLLKPFFQNLDGTVFNAKNKRLIADVKVAMEDTKYPNQSLNIKDQQFTLNEAILSARCPRLLELNLPCDPNKKCDHSEKIKKPIKKQIQKRRKK